jgi:hypothetical protein
MSSTLWVGIIVIVSALELVRIALSTYVLLQILESRPLRQHGEASGQAGRSLRTAAARARREALLDQTLVALRGAMDEVAHGRAGSNVERAIAALDDYAVVLAGIRERDR